MHVQGSGLVQLGDGSSVRLTFDGKNGHAYTSVSKLLVERGELAREDAHLEGTIAWLRARPERLELSKRKQILHILQRAGALRNRPTGFLRCRASRRAQLGGRPALPCARNAYMGSSA